MNLDDQLRAALAQEADMHDIPRPDLDRLVSGGRARRRRRTTVRLGAVAAAAVLVGGGAYAVAQTDARDDGSGPGPAGGPTRTVEPEPATYTNTGSSLTEPGTYRRTVGAHQGSGKPIEVDLTFGTTDWYSGAQPVLTPDGPGAAGVAVLQASRLPTGDTACVVVPGEGVELQDASTDAARLADQLAGLPDATVEQPPTSTNAFGHPAHRLRLEVDATCPGTRAYCVVDSDAGPLGLTYNAPFEVLLDLTVVDLDGTAVVVALWHETSAPAEHVAEATRVRDSVTFVPDER